MAKATETAATAAPKSEMAPTTAFDYQAVLDANSENMQACMRAGEAWLHGMASLNGEVMSFANRRLQDQFATQENLSHCTDLESAFRVNVDFAQNATQQYLEEASKLMTMAADLARESMAPFETRTRETLRRFNGD